MVVSEAQSKGSMQTHLRASYQAQLLETRINLHVGNCPLCECEPSSMWVLLQRGTRSHPSAEPHRQSCPARHLKPRGRSCSLAPRLDPAAACMGSSFPAGTAIPRAFCLFPSSPSTGEDKTEEPLS